MISENFNVFVGSTTGTLKGVTVGSDTEGAITARSKFCTKNKDSISNKNDVTFMCWADKEERELLIASKNKIRVYDTVIKEFGQDILLENNEDPIEGLFKFDETFVAGFANGVVKTWKSLDDCEEFKVGGNLGRMRPNPANKRVIATGGKDNNLKTWNIETKQCLFNAKNVKPDALQLAIPISVSDIAFHSDDEISTCTRHGYVRLYDLRSGQRRPVVNFHMQDQAFTCMATTNLQRQVLVGSSTGDLHLIDLRSMPKRASLGKFKGFAGAVKSVVCPDKQSLVFTVSLDRHFRIHDLKSRKPLYKEYMLSRLTTLVVRSNFTLGNLEPKEMKSTCSEEEPIEDAEEPENQIMQEESKTLDDIFSNLETVGNETLKAKRKQTMEENNEESDKVQVVKKIKWRNKER